MFKGILIQKDDSGYQAALQDIDESHLPEGDVSINVKYSTINYKDALAITGKGPVVRQFPMVPGIDLVGEVTHSDSEQFSVGQHVLLNGWGVGEKHWGGLAAKARVNSQWLIPLPDSLSPAHAMAIGTAGYTAMLSVIALERHGITPDSGSILVTGANGGVGSFAIGLLSQLGYHVVASTGRAEESSYLKALGANEIIDRAQLSEPGKPLAKEAWAGAIDSVGSHTLANVCAGIRYGGVVTACGLAQGMDFPATVAPFILRGITLAGIDSVMRPTQDRIEAWERLAQFIDAEQFDNISTTIGLSDVIDHADKLLKGQVRGRIVVDIEA